MNQNYNGYNPNYNNPNYNNYNNQNYDNQDYVDNSNRGGGCLSFIIALIILIVTVSVLLQMVGIVDFKELYDKYINKNNTSEKCVKETTMKETLIKACSSLDENGKYINDDKHISCIDNVCTSFDDELTYTYTCQTKEYTEKPLVKKEYLTNLSKEDLQNKLTNKEEFVLLISSKTNDTSYEDTIKKILKDYDLTIYSYDLDILSEEEQKTFKENLKVEETPVIMFIKEGVEDTTNRLIGVKTEEEIKTKFKELTIIKEIE